MNIRKQIYSVSSVNQYIKSLFMDDYALNNIYVKGEVSNCKYHPSGHIYFTLKDKAGAIACVMFAGNRRGLNFKMAEGMSVVVYGSVGIYERDGRYQLYARTITRDGVGQLYEAYEALKKKLMEEGLFDASHKKPVPAFPAKLGVLTASSGAALQDILNVSLRRNPYIQIVFCSATVQGAGAAKSIAAGIRALEDYGVDVMIVGRGGGSIEDLWGFNEEIVARAVYNCRVPVISAVGHETDTTIIDYVADLRAPTPSAAAELAVPDVRSLISRIEDYRNALDTGMADALNARRRQAENYAQLLKAFSPVYQLQEKRQRLMDTEDRLALLMNRQLEGARHRSALYAGRLDGLSPLKQLERGYAYLTDGEGHGISSIEHIRPGDLIRAEVTDGQISACVTQVEQSEK